MNTTLDSRYALPGGTEQRKKLCVAKEITRALGTPRRRFARRMPLRPKVGGWGMCSMRLIIVSNRLPFTVSLKEGAPRYKPSSGGLTTGLWSYLERERAAPAGQLEFVWMGWPGANIPTEHQAEVSQYGETHYRALPVFVPEESMERFYHGFCNRTLWPLFHYFPTFARFEEDYWQEYQHVNQLFGEALLRVLRPDDLLWVHDYQLMLLPRLVRERFPEMPIGFFLHIPFPTFEVFQLLRASWRSELIEGLLGASLIGFHTHDYARHFLSCVLRTVGHEHNLGRLLLGERVVKVDTFPMGIDFEKFSQAAASPAIDERLAGLREKFAGQKVIFSVDRLDYTKGLTNRLRGFDQFLRRNPQWQGKVVFVLSVAPSRTGVETYQTMKQELEQLVGRIVGAHGHVHWTPLVYQYRTLSFTEIVTLYRLCDVALITPLRDGMNLVAKEFLASRPDQTGVLILSEMAGAAKEMGEALIINPFHHSEIAQALEQALLLPVEEQIRRNLLMQERLQRYDVKRWVEDFLQGLMATQATQAAQRARALTGKAHSALVQQYRAAQRRALLLDYDGTLVPFVGDPNLARPDEELLRLLASLAGHPANELAIISGRPRCDLEEWFGHLPLALVAEHGVWLRARGGAWRALRVITAEWKQQVRPILQLYVDRMPGALLEEKEFSLAWHYRRADPEQGPQRAKELLDALAEFTRNIDVQVLDGNKVIEVRNTGATKGTAASEWLTGRPLDFILAIGDDWTDEDLFRALPPTAYSVRVGVGKTAARYHLNSQAAVRRLLRELNEFDRVAGTPALEGLGQTEPSAAPAPDVRPF
jgi:trehalose 6-phosphate synthase/phosphatase